MMKRLFSLLLMLCPILVFAGFTNSFAPPTTDYSVGWLADIFGIVDGVLHGTGSQIIGRMFSVFNAAVMALGGMIITYTMLVSTMNTAHEGEMLGKKWSSIWVPVRATAGFALLVPKASGYCMLQISVMWIVVQGVGAADKLWDAALGYLNSGGVIIQGQQDPTKSMIGGSGSDKLTEGAISILSGQVCMLAVERILKNKYAAYTNTSGGLGSSKCSGDISGNPGLQEFCVAGAVPSFSGSLDLKTANDQATGPTPPVIKMPNFDLTAYSFYAKLNGICGTISWNLMDNANITTLNAAGLTTGELQTAKDARVIAIQQMYSDLLLVAQVMINNDPDPAFSLSNGASTGPASNSTPPPNLMAVVATAAATSASNTGPYKPWATNPFGVPLDQNNQPCPQSGMASCTYWGTTGSAGGALLNGTELVGSVLDYNGVIKPTLTLLQQAATGAGDDNGKQFIARAKSSGWIMAGAYFFDLVKLNNLNVATSATINSDPNSGLDASKFNLSTLQNSFPAEPSTNGAAGCPSVGGFEVFCQVLEGNTAALNPIYSLFTGVPATSTQVITPIPSQFDKAVVTANIVSAILSTGNPTNAPQDPTSVFGYAQNSLVIQVPGQPPNPPLQFANMMHTNFSGTSFSLPNGNFDCGGFDLFFTRICIGRILGNIFYNDIIVKVFNYLLAFLESFIYGIVMNMLMIPLDAIAAIFTVGVKILDVPGINPIVALAQMGTYYINFVGKLWFELIFIEFITNLLNVFMWPLAAIMVIAMPITIAWSLIMLGVGTITAYYVPIIPYMIFLFGSFAWFMAVIEAMVAAPIVALGVIHPEGHDIFGKGEAAIMILMNVFLRPAMMIIGFITAISLCYVGVWVLNAGFDNAIGFMQKDPSSQSQSALTAPGSGLGSAIASAIPDVGTVTGGYTQWAGVFAFMFSILIYTTIYMTLVEKSFTLISSLPDNILRWIGGQQERHGQESAAWAGDVKKAVEKAEGDSTKAMLQAGKAAQAKVPTGSGGKAAAKEGG